MNTLGPTSTLCKMACRLLRVIKAFTHRLVVVLSDCHHLSWICQVRFLLMLHNEVVLLLTALYRLFFVYESSE